ncbi:MAG: phosphomannomutase/phosphoglucomutase [Thiotrichaceae bacterium]|nr:phosphomannomutase/phosphoglucomutase [Thiotrichaceae bacterium]PCI10600.1 MAG: phosphomannomutase/phosphoglucomutase [Thiotrichales bacterium]PCI11781.1 MAG: phosphomannomutase/phosphoglucomutase [Thiotrichales bacterium]
MGSNVSASIFKAYDIRGIVGETLTEEVVYNIGRAIGSEAHARQQKTVAVARDGRLSGGLFVAALTRGLRDTGRDVIDVGMVPTPLLYFAAHYLDIGSGVMVTGSHNPTNYNGFKMVLGGETLAEEAIQSLRRRIEQEDYHLGGDGAYRAIDIIPDYLACVLDDIKLPNQLKVVVDCGNGVAGVIAPQLLRKLGCDVIELFCEVDGNFPNHHPDPSQPKNLQDMILAVKAYNADLGFAFDGDGDRLGVVDSSGHIIWPDRQMMLYAADVLSRNPGAKIIYDIKCSNHLGKVIEQHGGKPLMWKTGHSLIKAKMKETGALLAGEMSGHIFFKERWYGFDDGIYTGARLLEILTHSDAVPKDLFATLPESYSTPELQVKMVEGEHHAFIKRFLAEVSFDDGEVTTIDGMRVDFGDGWGLVRASNTTPCLVIRFEADNEEALRRIQGMFKAAMLKIAPDLVIPF